MELKTEVWKDQERANLVYTYLSIGTLILLVGNVIYFIMNINWLMLIGNFLLALIFFMIVKSSNKYQKQQKELKNGKKRERTKTMGKTSKRGSQDIGRGENLPIISITEGTNP